MNKVIYENTKVPIKLWLDDIEEGALNQAKNAANLPFAYHHIAIMPDAHQGYGVSIGTVLATEGVVIPNAVGVDIGCGMCAVKTTLKVEQLDKETLKKIMGKIREVIPVGFEHRKLAQDERLMPPFTKHLHTAPKYFEKYIIGKEYSSALKQIGTLGGGNHFIEIQKEVLKCDNCNGKGEINTDDLGSYMPCLKCNKTGKNNDLNSNIWITIHSGSRNLGYKVAKYYNDLAIELNKKWYSSIPKEWELAFLPIETQEAKDYMREMQYCVDFALANRKLMMDKIIEIFETFYQLYRQPIVAEEMINIAHNYAIWENHYGKNIIIHRKGATLARKGTIGIIPGSIGSKSYIIKGLGNLNSFQSCSHGAGRKLGRKAACKTLNLEEEIKKLDDQGIIHGLRNQTDLDEATSAYKNIDTVMKNQEDLVEIITELHPIAVIKG